MSDDLIRNIFDRELSRLDAISQERALDLEELKALDLLTKSLKQFYKQEQPPQEDELSNLSTEELIKLITKDNSPHETTKDNP